MHKAACVVACLSAVILPVFGCTREGSSIDPPGLGGAGGGPFPVGSGGGCGFSGSGGAEGTGRPGGSNVLAQPQFGTTVVRESAPPAISGGTLLVLHDGHTAVASDPDRDSVSVVDLTSRTVKVGLALSPGDEPGRLVEDAAGRVHVALRRGGAVVTLLPPAFTVSDRQAVCAAPRGLAYDAKSDRVHVACAGGELVSLGAAGGAPVRTLKLDADLRDVVVDGDGLLVSRFRSAQILSVSAAGTVTVRRTPPPARSPDARGGASFSPSVAWRMTAMPGGGVAMVHQRGLLDEVPPQAGGYGTTNPCDAIVQTALTVIRNGQMPQAAPALPGLVLPVDLAISPDGKRVAIVAAGNATNSPAPGMAPTLPRVFAADIADVTDPNVGCRPDGKHGPCMDGVFVGTREGPDGSVGFDGTGGQVGTGGQAGAPSFDAGATGDFTDASIQPPPLCPPDGELPVVNGQPIAVAYDGGGKLVVQTREPAALLLPGGGAIALSADSREDTGHTIFHSNAGGFVACASCHAEGAEDGRVWSFACEGQRRTQSLASGISGTEPFHWNGDMKTFPVLMDNVFVGRMSGPKLVPEQQTATLHWIDHQPRAPKAAPADPAAVARGRALFTDKTVACGSCHSGDKLTNNMNADVGTGGMFQVPSLLGLAARAPFMHDGCAATLADRFSNAGCGGGDHHGVTSTLSPAQLGDLIAYLDTL